MHFSSLERCISCSIYLRECFPQGIIGGRVDVAIQRSIVFLFISIIFFIRKESVAYRTAIEIKRESLFEDVLTQNLLQAFDIFFKMILVLHPLQLEAMQQMNRDHNLVQKALFGVCSDGLLNGQKNTLFSISER